MAIRAEDITIRLEAEGAQQTAQALGQVEAAEREVGEAAHEASRGMGTTAQASSALAASSTRAATATNAAAENLRRYAYDASKYKGEFAQTANAFMEIGRKAFEAGRKIYDFLSSRAELSGMGQAYKTLEDSASQLAGQVAQIGNEWLRDSGIMNDVSLAIQDLSGWIKANEDALGSWLNAAKSCAFEADLLIKSLELGGRAFEAAGDSGGLLGDAVDGVATAYKWAYGWPIMLADSLSEEEDAHKRTAAAIYTEADALEDLTRRRKIYAEQIADERADRERIGKYADRDRERMSAGRRAFEEGMASRDLAIEMSRYAGEERKGGGAKDEGMVFGDEALRQQAEVDFILSGEALKREARNKALDQAIEDYASHEKYMKRLKIDAMFGEIKMRNDVVKASKKSLDQITDLTEDATSKQKAMYLSVGMAAAQGFKSIGLGFVKSRRAQAAIEGSWETGLGIGTIFTNPPESVTHFAAAVQHFITAAMPDEPSGGGSSSGAGSYGGGGSSYASSSSISSPAPTTDKAEKELTIVALQVDRRVLGEVTIGGINDTGRARTGAKIAASTIGAAQRRFWT